eukprot:14021013-Alexandrium_andersonii.AAC.1
MLTCAKPAYVEHPPRLALCFNNSILMNSTSPPSNMLSMQGEGVRAATYRAAMRRGHPSMYHAHIVVE